MKPELTKELVIQPLSIQCVISFNFKQGMVRGLFANYIDSYFEQMMTKLNFLDPIACISYIRAWLTHCRQNSIHANR